MKFEITHSGAVGAKGEHKIGEVVELEKLPGYLLGKCRKVAEEPKAPVKK